MTNIKVEVNIDEINPGENLILTLADQNILDGDNINEEEDHLENPDIKEKDQLEFRKRQIDKIKKKNYSQKYEEYDNGQKANLLSHYDEDKLTKEGFYIDQDGQVANQKKKEIDLIQSKLSKQNNHQISLLYEDKIASDYKPYIPNTFVKKKIIKQNDEFPKEEQIPKVPKFDQSIEVDDYTLLQQSILNKQRKKYMKNEEKLRQIIQGNSEIEKQNKISYDTQLIKLQPDAQEIREISSATDFLSSVKTEKEMEEINLRNTAPSNYSIKDTRAGTASILNVSLPTERLRNKQEKISIEEDEQQIQVNEPIKDEQIIQQLEEVLEEKQLGKGLADTLRLFKERGDLKQNNYDFQGRAKDEKVKNVNGDDDQVRLEYRDGSGRLMTQKEAFRYQCWKFHGEAPSKTKIEKRKKKDLLSQKQKRIQTGGLMKTLQENQKKSQNPYMIISKKKQLTE